MDPLAVTVTAFTSEDGSPSTQGREPRYLPLGDVIKGIKEPSDDMIRLKQTCVERYPRYRDAWSAYQSAVRKFGKEHVPPDVLDEYRTAKDEYDGPKAYFPSVFFSGAFSGRKDADITEPSGFMMIDIDGKEQPEATEFSKNITLLKAQVFTLPFVQAVFMSASDDGFHILVRIEPSESSPDYLKEYYRQVYVKIANALSDDLDLDADAACKNLGRPCFASPDPDVLFKEKVVSSFPFKFSKTEATKEERRERGEQRNEMKQIAAAAKTSNRSFAEAILSECRSKRLNLTKRYDDWLKIGVVLKREFSDDGWDLFRGFSEIDARFREEECRTMWDTISIDQRATKVTFATLVWMAKIAGVELVNQLPIADRVEQFVDANYDLRMNTLDKGVYWRARGSDDDLKLFDLDFDDSYVARAAERSLGTAVGAGTLQRVVRDIARRSRWNPITDYLTSLHWDGVDRIAAVAKTIKTDDDDLFAYYFPKWLVGIVACGMGDIHNDKVIVLVGPQGIKGKTHFLRNIFPERANGWTLTHAVTKFDPANKDDLRLAFTSLLIIFDEMSAYAKSDLDQLKALITMDSMTYRGVYGKSYNSFWKTASFAGCTNNAEFLRDPTGDRRYCPFEVLDRDKDAFDEIVKDREQILAQAVAMYSDGFQHRLSTDDYLRIMERNRQRYTLQSTDEMMLNQYLMPSTSQEDMWSLPEIISEFKRRFGHDLKSSTATLGKNLASMGIVSKVCHRDGKSIRLYPCKFFDPLGGVSVEDLVFGKKEK